MSIAMWLELTDDGGIFRHGQDGAEGDAELDKLLDQRDSGDLSLKRYVLAIAALVERYPGFIDGHAHLALAYLDQGNLKMAVEAAQRGVAIGQQAIPPGFNSPIDWGWLENRPFLRAVHTLTLCHQRLGHRREAIAMMSRLLRWNPNDNQGVRFLLGSEYLRDGNTKKASQLMKREADRHPPYLYELALIDLIAGNMIGAATLLRRAFVVNGYVAEILCGNPDPLPLAIWHGSNLAEPEIAGEYVEHYGDLWRTTPAAIAFLRWLHTHPKVLAERARIYGIKEQLLWENDPLKRRALLDQEEDFMEAIDDGLSNEIVVKHLDRGDRPIEPWLYPSTRPKYKL